eukprot:134658-Pleurochrysis_carterae.AAC.3
MLMTQISITICYLPFLARKQAVLCCFPSRRYDQSFQGAPARHGSVCVCVRAQVVRARRFLCAAPCRLLRLRVFTTKRTQGSQ